jgi:hypothetical protein
MAAPYIGDRVWWLVGTRLETGLITSFGPGELSFTAGRRTLLHIRDEGVTWCRHERGNPLDERIDALRVANALAK